MITLSTLSDFDFQRLSRLITAQCGIRMPAIKKTMVQGRLQKRVRHLRLGSLAEYCDYLFSPEGMRSELPNMIDSVTTNKTDFFREPAHYEFLMEKALPELLRKRVTRLDGPLRVWSAGCSTGEEPYTLAMVLSDFSKAHEGFSGSIFATDISSRALDAAGLAVYNAEKAEPVPMDMKKKYLVKSRDSERALVRVKPELRGLVTFQKLNLVEEYSLDELMDVIFFRNVLIYFDRETQEKLLQKMTRFLSPGGYLFIGHSETLNGMGLPLQQEAPAIYRRV
jgi:chemotaxis protein methyltransferase CheR